MRDLALRDAEQPRELPLGRQFLIALGATAFHAIVYFSANHWPLSEPRELPLTALDTSTPFVPSTVFMYVSDYILVFAAFMSLHKRENVMRFVEVFLSCVVIAGAVHWLYPTRYPREAFPVPAETDALSRLALSVLYFFDTPNSCLPSLHVGTATVSSLLVWRERKPLAIALFVWSLGVAASTLTAKQHYAIDIIAGWLLAGAVLVVVDLARGRARSPLS